jgi:hypothetical protein
MAVHDGRGGRNAESVGGGNHVNPLGRTDSSWRNLVSDLVVQDLSGRSRQASNTRVLEFSEVLSDTHPRLA